MFWIKNTTTCALPYLWIPYTQCQFLNSFTHTPKGGYSESANRKQSLSCLLSVIFPASNTVTERWSAKKFGYLAQQCSIFFSSHGKLTLKLSRYTVDHSWHNALQHTGWKLLPYTYESRCSLLPFPKCSKAKGKKLPFVKHLQTKRGVLWTWLEMGFV